MIKLDDVIVLSVDWVDEEVSEIMVDDFLIDEKIVVTSVPITIVPSV